MFSHPKEGIHCRGRIRGVKEKACSNVIKSEKAIRAGGESKLHEIQSWKKKKRSWEDKCKNLVR